MTPQVCDSNTTWVVDIALRLDSQKPHKHVHEYESVSFVSIRVSVLETWCICCALILHFYSLLAETQTEEEALIQCGVSRTLLSVPCTQTTHRRHNETGTSN